MPCVVAQSGFSSVGMIFGFWTIDSPPRAHGPDPPSQDRSFLLRGLHLLCVRLAARSTASSWPVRAQNAEQRLTWGQIWREVVF